MSQSEIGFRTAALGFRREDVLEFIAQETKHRQEIEEELERIRQEAAELRREREEADRASKTLLADHEEDAAVLQKKDREIEALQEELEQGKREREQLKKELEQEKQAQDHQRAEYTALEQELEALKAQNEVLSSKCGEYDNARSRLADIELCAHGRADAIERRAEEQAEALIEEAKRMTEQLLQTITQSKGAYWEALEAVERETERAHARTVDALSKFDGIMEALHAQVTAQLEAEPASEQAEQATDAKEDREDQTMHTQHERPTLAQVLGALRGGK